jgi:hypothetical protein
MIIGGFKYSHGHGWIHNIIHGHGWVHNIPMWCYKLIITKW